MHIAKLNNIRKWSSCMDKRTEVIFAVLANKAQNIKAEMNEHFNSGLYKHKVEVLRTKAKNTYLEKQRRWQTENLDGWKEAEAAFHEAAYEYLLYGLHIQDGLYISQENRISRFNKEWEALEEILKTSGSISDAVAKVDDTISYDRRLDEELELGNYTDNPSEFKRLKLALAAKRLQEYDLKFGPKAIFEKAGKHFVEKLFHTQARSKGRPPRHRGRDINTFRAYQFMRLVNSINEELKKVEFEKTTISEVSELCFGDEQLLSDYANNAEIKWLLSTQFKTDGITVRAFLNSISRGKARFVPDDWEFV